MSVVAFNFNGTVKNCVDSTIKSGDSINGSVAYGDTQTGFAGVYNFQNSSKEHTFAYKDFRVGVQITSDRYAGLLTSPYTIKVSAKGGTFTLTGPTTAGRSFQLIITNPNPPGTLALPKSMAGFDLTAVTVNFLSGGGRRKRDYEGRKDVGRKPKPRPKGHKDTM
jgi:hypothetical protein